MRKQKTPHQKRIDRGVGTRRKLHGQANEVRAWRLCTKLQKNTLLPFTIENVVRTKPNSLEDRKGYDILVKTDRGIIPLQVKSSEKVAEKFRQKRPEIPCIVVNREFSDETLCSQIVDKLNEYYCSLPRPT